MAKPFWKDVGDNIQSIPSTLGSIITKPAFIQAVSSSASSLALYAAQIQIQKMLR